MCVRLVVESVIRTFKCYEERGAKALGTWVLKGPSKVVSIGNCRVSKLGSWKYPYAERENA
ncbi:hypothetical protein JZ751_008349 [Albula glossodonta]|uniref:Uncharacterized protein n=1 Tax=Albula glossodonta TaxID=121402 RepID=A0A8T2N6N7_9TELE|nr:hypothetical protein JZ751_008349 [Albula glossodonta]